MPSISEDMTDFLVDYESTINVPSDFKNKDLYSLEFNDRPYGKQYASIYATRLAHLRPRVLHNAKKKWGEEVVNGKKVVKKEKVLDIHSDEPSWVVGTIFCDMKYKPNILDEVSSGIQGADTSIKTYTDPDLDQIMLEDESGRVALEGDLVKNTILVTGTVVGILGMESRPGVFQVVDIVYPFTSAQKPTRKSSSKVAIVSGLHFNGLESIKHEALKDYLTGELGLETSKSVSRLIIAGNSVLVSGEPEVDEKNKYGAKNKSNFSLDSITQLDTFLTDTLQSIPIDMMPGESDPAETSLPQQPLHKAFFQKSKAYLNTSTFRTITNPAWIQYDELRLLGTSGENINDIYKYVVPNSVQDSRINMIEATMVWQNIIPTAPDTLWCYPYSDKDPFSLTETPHVYFVGNQPKYETKMLQLDNTTKVKLIAIPTFSETGQFVILDTDTLESEVITLDS
ncbi:DNA polymerase delta subunit 2 [Wickerhamomyces ciferrii]|uniref:DNA-directed DNA polymerase n=1 Tax=Wickerhamomyces ciferrii (strain ATCC 14091 / BCRC 22168 / CBS 111 / JCM 3599 / NBRC 0793 / NRRL Y-1031 F-60-10) TaxID=1206466 RepID=K0KHJ3_WICCF|nr:DNA polymerase delta subunit 2 [Wickerhamomyces ciferrii]CCH41647.1 DNA polymerase delta subunit 2 [Wickerhamomyces ciferrii]